MSVNKDKVVIVNGQRASGLLSEEQAKKAADTERAKLNERDNKPVQERNVSVKTNLFG